MHRVADFFLRFHNRERSLALRLISLLLGSLFFLIILPAGFILVGRIVKDAVGLAVPGYVDWLVLIPCLGIGGVFLSWAVLTLWTAGEGTPAPNAPTRRLVVSGPYRLCRNPIEFGAIFYYAGIGTLAGGIVVGLVCFLLGLIVGSAYHKFVEEREMEVRFGDEYREYRKRVPFLIPRLEIRL